MSNTKLIPTLVIAGGDCAGKSGLIRRIAADYGDQTYIVREAATLLLGSPLNTLPPPGEAMEAEATKRWQPNFQALVASASVAQEILAQETAKQIGADIIILDRGMYDHYAYLPENLWAEFNERMGVSPNKLASRYSGAIYLQSLAVANPELWQSIQGDGNEHRIPRDISELQELDRQTELAWEMYSEAGGRIEWIKGERTEESHLLVAKRLIAELIGC